jgi:hypothetical protein
VPRIRPSLRTGAVGTFGYLQNTTGISFAQSNIFGIQEPDWQGLLQVPSAMVLRLAPNSSPLEVSFNPDEPNLQLSCELHTKSVTLMSRG